MRTPRPWPATLIVAATALALLIAVASVLTRAARPGAERIVLYAGLAARTPVVLAIYTGRLLCLAAGAQAKRRTTRGRGVKGGRNGIPSPSGGTGETSEGPGRWLYPTTSPLGLLS